ncbi:hypothetical protein CRUP_002231 [Coryphaenoides rupestris]|nr:hypothetical protein CRUP_002231 [Coryphaenoides rupestris]
MLDFAIFAVTFVMVLVACVVYLYPEFGPVASFWFGGRPVVSLGSVEQLQQHINPNRTTDSFETMLKSLLGYQSAAGGGGATETVMRKKMYASAVDNALKEQLPAGAQGAVSHLVEELVEKWASFPRASTHPLCAHMLGLAVKTVTQLALGPRFRDDDKIGKGYLDGSLDKSSSRKSQYETALSNMESLLQSVVRERRSQAERDVFVDTLLQSNLTERQIMEDSMVFTLAGCVITANLCVWAVHFLSTEEEVQEKLYRELEETLVIYAMGVVLQDANTWSAPYRLQRLEEAQVMEVKSELVTAPKDDTWVTVAGRRS